MNDDIRVKVNFLALNALITCQKLLVNYKIFIERERERERFILT